MKDEAINLLLLDFKDEETEKNFIKEYDGENRVFFRLGIYLSCLAWFIWYSGIYFSHYQVFATAFAILLIVLLIPFIIVVTLSFYKKYSTLTHNITAFCNFAAAGVCIYVAVYLSEDITFLVSGVICISFFCYFILRIRFKVSLVITFSYAIIAQFCVISSGNFNDNQIITSSSGIYLGFFIAMIAGYFFEKTNRKIFIQNMVINEQQNELIIERNKIKKSLEELKSTQAQLIQSEKMASLGQLTAGIAHEIQNPLNFVNNFSEVSGELIEEIQEARTKNQDKIDIELENEILGDIKQNLEKIHHHGKRADAIVKGMLAHSRSGKGDKQPTDINALAEEYLRLSYHGLRSKDKSFNADFKTDFDPNLPKVNVVPQDIGRVLLNLINNAFQACTEKDLSGFKNLTGLTPIVSISTKNLGDKIEISVQDNGPGIPDAIKEKIL
jgi:signal transduction histidine kinase